MSDETPRKPENGEAAKPKERDKVGETAGDKDQTERFRAIRRQLKEGEMAFSFSGVRAGTGAGSRFEILDGERQLAAATPNRSDARPGATRDGQPDARTAEARREAPPTAAPARPTERPADPVQAAKDAEAIRKATGNDNWIARWADKEAINKILEGKTDAERKAIDDAYKARYGRGLEAEMRDFLKGSDLDKFLNVLNRQDNNAENTAARRIHENLLENRNLIEGRSSDQIEKDIRALVSTRNADQITRLDQQYRELYGTSLQDAISKDDEISQSTKDMVAIYLKGNDRRTDADTAQLIDIALREKDTDLFAESMRDASPAARKAFIDNGGEQKINDVFGHWYSNSDVRHAMDLAREGKLSAATQIRDNTGVMFDNSAGTELVIKRMTDQERKQYVDGKAISQGREVPGLSPEDAQRARDYYRNVHDALSNTANATEMLKYENMIATKGDGTLVAAMAKHRGTFYNSSVEEITNDVRNMTSAQYEDAKSNPSRRAELEQMLTSLNKDEEERRQVLSVYDKMLAAGDYEKAREAGKPQLSDQIAASQHWYGSNAEQLLSSITNMSATDQNRYRTDEQFRAQIDKSVRDSLSSPDYLDSAQRMLNQVKAGKAPDSDPIAILKSTYNFEGEKTESLARRIDAAFDNDPSLRERLINPKTEEDRRFAEEFKRTAQRTFREDYDRIGKPLVETGNLPLDVKVSLNKGVFSDAYEQAFKDLQSATPEEKQRLRSDTEYRRSVIGWMDENRQQIAMATLDQPSLRPEDNIRAAVVGWGGSSDIVNELKNIKPEELESVKAAYAAKYGSSLAGDLIGKLGKQDEEVAQRILAQNLSAEVRTNIARTQTENARSGIGATLSDSVFRSGTGEQLDDAMSQTERAISEQNRFNAAIAEGSELAGKLTPEQIQQAQQQFAAQIDQAIAFQNQGTDNALDSRKAAANYVADGAIITAAIGSMIVTGGLSTPLVVSLAAAGATIKVGANAAIQGNAYELNFGNLAYDGTVGAVTAATAVIGPGQIAAVFGIGKVAATRAATLTLAEAGEQVLAQGGKEALERGTREIVQNTLASGATKLSATDFTALASRVVSPELTGAAREQAVRQIAESLQKNVSEQLASGVVRHAQNIGLNAGGGAAGGTLSGAAEGTAEWDSRLSVAQNLANIAERSGQGAFGGAVLGGAVSTAGIGLGRAREAFRGSGAADNVRPGGISETPRDTTVAPRETATPPREGATPPRDGATPPRDGSTSPEAPTRDTTNPRDTTTPRDEGATGRRTESLPRRTNEQGQVLDSKGNILERDWPKVEPQNREAVRAQVRAELAQVKAADGVSVMDKLDSAGLTPAQKERVLDSLGEVREHYARTFATDVDQPVNWIHTQGELGRVIDAAKAAGLTPAQTEDAMLASMFSDSLKTKANFMTHHLDGEISAEHILRDRLGGDFTQERLDGILNAIREHQIAPPKFMAMIYGGAIKGIVEATEKRALTEAEDAALKSLLGKISNPFKAELTDAPGGGKMLLLTDEERALLRRTGNENWFVPAEGTPWNKISRALIDGDGIDNYATPGGLSKIIQIRGPETGPFFKDGNIRFENPGRAPNSPPSSSQESWRDSFNDFADVASPNGLRVARSAAADAEQDAIAAQGRVDAWLRERLNIPAGQELPVIPGWTGKPKLDASGKPMLDGSGRPTMEPDNVVYPQYEPRWWDIHKKPASARTPEETAYYEANRYRGLTDQQIKDFNFLKEIRDRYVSELRREQRVARDAAPDYKPVVPPRS